MPSAKGTPYGDAGRQGQGVRVAATAVEKEPKDGCKVQRSSGLAKKFLKILRRGTFLLALFRVLVFAFLSSRGCRGVWRLGGRSKSSFWHVAWANLIANSTGGGR